MDCFVRHLSERLRHGLNITLNTLGFWLWWCCCYLSVGNWILCIKNMYWSVMICLLLLCCFLTLCVCVATHTHFHISSIQIIIHTRTHNSPTHSFPPSSCRRRAKTQITTQPHSSEWMYQNPLESHTHTHTPSSHTHTWISIHSFAKQTLSATLRNLERHFFRFRGSFKDYPGYPWKKRSPRCGWFIYFWGKRAKLQDEKRAIICVEWLVLLTKSYKQETRHDGEREQERMDGMVGMQMMNRKWT